MKTEHPEQRQMRYEARVKIIVNMIETTFMIHKNEVPDSTLTDFEKTARLRRDVLKELNGKTKKANSKGQDSTGRKS